MIAMKEGGGVGDDISLGREGGREGGTYGCHFDGLDAFDTKMWSKRREGGREGGREGMEVRVAYLFNS